ncbi:hypothetical protein F2Q70_00030847 [Brassica cretica]|uniref:Uncharacterized protein n=1 Tax=Brassica cretica TaxID=69181 RepID=A0A8S9FIN1_BRACR|nr:hypothetical protein F2Q70_00030847 [Brassica cretica]
MTTTKMVFQIWKTSGLEDFQMTSRKSSRRLPESLLTESSLMSPIHNRSERFGFNQTVLIFHLDMYFVCFTYLGLIYIFLRSGSDFGRRMGSLFGSLLNYNALEDFQEVFQTTSRKSSDGVFFHIKFFRSGRLLGYKTSRKTSCSRRLPGSLLTESSPVSPFHNRSERFGFNQMVLIFHLDMYFVCSIKVFTDMGLIYMFFRSGSDFGRPMGSLLKYNALEDFLPGSLLTGSSSISSGV